MTCWTDRIALARAGWHTELAFTTVGIREKHTGMRAVGCWARSWYWQGWIADTCLHDHAILDITSKDAYAKVSALVGNVREVCERAARDYPDSIPCMGNKKDSDGRITLAQNNFETKHAHLRPRQYHPTENIPPHSEVGVLDPESDHLAQLINAAKTGVHIEDRINSYFGRARYAKDCKDRDWGYRLRLALREAGGVKVSFQPREFSVDSLHEDLVCGLISTSAKSLNQLFDRYGSRGDLSGRTENNLPPGFRTLAEQIAREDSRKAEVDNPV